MVESQIVEEHEAEAVLDLSKAQLHQGLTNVGGDQHRGGVDASKQMGEDTRDHTKVIGLVSGEGGLRGLDGGHTKPEGLEPGIRGEPEDGIGVEEPPGL